eukprot:jgi/Bigna1/137824/aug1.41_g12532
MQTSVFPERAMYTKIGPHFSMKPEGRIFLAPIAFASSKSKQEKTVELWLCFGGSLSHEFPEYISALSSVLSQDQYEEIEAELHRIYDGNKCRTRSAICLMYVGCCCPLMCCQQPSLNAQMSRKVTMISEEYGISARLEFCWRSKETSNTPRHIALDQYGVALGSSAGGFAAWPPMGSGNFADTFVATVAGGRDVALKIPKAPRKSEDEALDDEDWKELRAMGALKQHPNVLEFVGIVTMDRLMKEDCTVVIADYGLSRKLGRQRSYYRQIDSLVAWGWIAPESFEGKFSTKSDIWMLGVSIWEILTKVVMLCREEAPNGWRANESQRLSAEEAKEGRSAPYSGLDSRTAMARIRTGDLRLQLPSELAGAKDLRTELFHKCHRSKPGKKATRRSEGGGVTNQWGQTMDYYALGGLIRESSSLSLRQFSSSILEDRPTAEALVKVLVAATKGKERHICKEIKSEHNFKVVDYAYMSGGNEKNAPPPPSRGQNQQEEGQLQRDEVAYDAPLIMESKSEHAS